MVELDHFFFGTFSGYSIQMKTAGINEEGIAKPFGEKFIPIAQNDFKYVEDVRCVLPYGDDLLLTRLYQGPSDDHGRGSVANHTAVIPWKELRKGGLTLQDVNTAMEAFEKANPKYKGMSNDKLSVTPSGEKSNIKALNGLLPRETVEEIIGHFSKKRDQAKVFVKFKASTQERVDAVYALTNLLDIRLRKCRIGAFSDLPYREGQQIFNLIVSRVKIDMNAGGDWVEVDPKNPKPARINFNEKTRGILDSIYGGK